MWVLESITDFGKISSVQVAILLEFARAKDEVLKITDIIEKLEESFKDLWEPKKGTIYPAIHNLSVRGFLKVHAVKPYGYSINEKGLELIEAVIKNINLQLKANFQFYLYAIRDSKEINPELIKKTIEEALKIINDYTKEIKAV
ncbi:MAG: PadR family transcriptional regulator [Asgard group archaeon]|nr:PadR family transcriptional regulator [Asgard group archaeon]